MNKSRKPTHRPSPTVTATDVARAAGVSQSAVSRTYTDGASVSSRTRTKVEEAARQLGYRPNLIARSLITRRSQIIGVAVAYMDNQFYPQLLQALSARLRQSDFRILVFTPDLSINADPGVDELLRYQVDALVLASTMLSSRVAEECDRAGVPVVLVNRKTHHNNVSSVTGDNQSGGAQIADFLVAGDHRSTAYIAGLEESSTSRDREAAFTQRLAHLGMPPPARVVGHYTFEGACAATRSLLASPAPPEAIFCANDHMALAAIETARSEFGLDIGREISIVGFDDVSVASWPSFSLTTFSQSVELMADHVAGILDDMLSGNALTPVQRVVEGQLIVRGSARRPVTGLVDDGGNTVWQGVQPYTA